MRIGVDLDNTIICYDALFHALALERGWIAPARPARPVRKDAVRRAVRLLPDGDEKWQALQAEAYGPRLASAALFPGVVDAFRLWREQGREIFVISHKTRRSSAGYDLHAAARAFLAESALMREGLLAEQDLFFCPSRREKLERIARLGCDVFIDDLPEVLNEPGFPAGVRKILFAPEEASSGRPGDAPDSVPDVRDCSALIFRSWAEAAAWDPEADAAVTRATGSAARRLERVAGGRNSRVWKAVPAAAPPVAVKRYPDDGRDRLGAESAAFALLRRHGLTCVPETLALFPERRLAVYSWIAGEPAAPLGDAPEAVDPFADLIERLRRIGAAPDAIPDAARLPLATEACLCLADVKRQVENRLSRLLARDPDTEAARAMLDLVRNKVAPAWEDRLRAASEAYARLGRPPDQALEPAERVLSPSDFGAHNAIRRPDGSLAFVDFEYFGWDDPVKLTADFLLHPAMRLTREQKERFAARVMGLFAESDAPARLPALLPLFAVRWICIVLNVFLPEHAGARRSGDPSAPSAASSPETQLETARCLLRTVNLGM